jgi:hypothetical protein
MKSQVLEPHPVALLMKGLTFDRWDFECGSKALIVWGRHLRVLIEDWRYVPTRKYICKVPYMADEAHRSFSYDCKTGEPLLYGRSQIPVKKACVQAPTKPIADLRNGQTDDTADGETKG